LRIRRKEAQEELAFHTHGETHSWRSSLRRKEAKVDAFEEFEVFSQVWEECAEAQEGAQQLSDRWREIDLDHWFICPRRCQEKHTEREIDSHWISFRNPISHWIR
jgi:hypothetical protein